jgi:hypothetical protein
MVKLENSNADDDEDVEDTAKEKQLINSPLLEPPAAASEPRAATESTLMNSDSNEPKQLQAISEFITTKDSTDAVESRIAARRQRGNRSGSKVDNRPISSLSSAHKIKTVEPEIIKTLLEQRAELEQFKKDEELAKRIVS